jgi:3-isopropylmalate dehydrogenase
VRDNIAGVYQGRSTSTSTPNAERVVRHEFAYAEGQVRALASAGVKLAATRTGRVTLAIKASGLPLVSELWSDVVRDVCSTASVELTILDADYCAYQLIQQPDAFDVLITPNLIGDILTDLGAVLLGSRGLTFSGNFSPTGHGVYQTNHGAAFDLVGTDRVNPAGQMLALAMMLRESFNLHREAEWIEAALGKIWQQGWRTADLDMSSEGTVGTDEFTWRVAQVIADGSLDRD